LITQVDNSCFSLDEKYLDSTSVYDLAKAIEQDILAMHNSKTFSRDSKEKRDKAVVLLYLPDGKSYHQMMNGLCNGSKLLKNSVQFTYFGKVCGPDIYSYFTGEVDAENTGLKKVGNPNAKTLVSFK
jgi:hypothetical protein